MYKSSITLTSDGSHTLYIPEMDEHYHSVHGAVSEAQHVYLNAGYHYCSELSSLVVLEVGFGTGLNCLLTALSAENERKPVRYFTIENYPLPDEITMRLNLPARFGERGKEIFALLHSSPWNRPAGIHPWFDLFKIRDDFTTAMLSEIPFVDLVYYDAFAPGKQPEMWEAGLLKKIFLKMNRGGVLVTYCAKGTVRRDFIQTGFTVERLPGPEGKREILRCLKV